MANPIYRALRELEAPCCGRMVQISLGIPTHDPQTLALKQVVQCTGCGDYFTTTVFLVTASEKITQSKPKLVLVYG